MVSSERTSKRCQTIKLDTVCQTGDETLLSSLDNLIRPQLKQNVRPSEERFEGYRNALIVFDINKEIVIVPIHDADVVQLSRLEIELPTTYKD